MSLDPAIASLVLAASSLLVALAYVVKKTNGCQLGTCCKVSIGPTPRPTQTAADIAQAVMPNLV